MISNIEMYDYDALLMGRNLSGIPISGHKQQSKVCDRDHQTKKCQQYGKLISVKSFSLIYVIIHYNDKLDLHTNIETNS